MDQLSQTEMASWLRPRDALLAVPAHVEESARKNWIIHRLRKGIITARQGNGGIIPASAWSLREIETDLWSMGDLCVTDEPEDIDLAGPDFFDGEKWSSEVAPIHVGRPTLTTTYFDVHFDPAAFRVDPDLSKTPLRRAPATSDLRQWYNVFQGVHPHATEDEAVRSAKAMFPDLHVSRQSVRELRGPQKRGKPKGKT